MRLDPFRRTHAVLGAGFGRIGYFEIPTRAMGRLDMLRVIASDGLDEDGDHGWEHVSVSLATRTPTWEEMARVKDLWWGPDECVFQFHPPENDYVRCHPHCLHLWKPTAPGLSIPLPPKWMLA